MMYTKAAFNFFFSIIFTGFLVASDLHMQQSNGDYASSSSPEPKEYDYLVIMGCHALNMSKRIKHAMELTDNGLTFKQLVFLACQRTLTEEETPAMIQEIFRTILPHNHTPLDNQRFPNHEASMLKFLLNHTNLPKTWHHTKKIFIESPMWQMREGILVEAQSSHTIEEWLKREPTPGSILAISDQDNIFKELLPAFNTEIINLDKPKKLSMAKL
jgi:hypothetical protein